MVRIQEPLSTFIHIPKTGGKSIHQWMTKLGGFDTHFNNSLYHICKRHGNAGHPTREKIEEHPEVYGDLGKVFTCVRNPWDRFVSGYYFMIQGGALAKNTKFEDFCRAEDRWRFMSVKQVEFIRDDDTVLKLENIDEDFKLMQDYYNCYDPLGTTNVTKGRNNTSYQKLYNGNKKLIDLIGKYFREDVEKFNYSYDNT